MRNLILGLDPGKSGGLAVLDLAGNIERIYGFTKGTETDLIDVLRECKDSIIKCYIEKIPAMPRSKRGVRASKGIGQAEGLLLGVLRALEIPFERVLPMVWQRNLRCLSRGDKKFLRQVAQDMFPDHRILINLATADALLIAEYGRRQFNQTKNLISKGDL